MLLLRYTVDLAILEMFVVDSSCHVVVPVLVYMSVGCGSRSRSPKTSVQDHS
jgi:hypothetical protein